jgi:hypothetical protein
LAEVAVLDEDAAGAEQLLEEGLALRREMNDQQYLGWCLNHRGHAAQLCGDYERAAQLHTESLTLFKTQGEKGNAVQWHLPALSSARMPSPLPGTPARRCRWIRRSPRRLTMTRGWRTQYSESQARRKAEDERRRAFILRLPSSFKEAISNIECTLV